MNKFLLTLCVYSVIAFSSCKTKNSCEQLPSQFSTYEDAVSRIKATSFRIYEKTNTSRSSWVKGASFYSCDGKTGYFILKTDKKEYLYSNIPYGIWAEFKNSESFGKYYNENIKHRYSFQLTQ